MNAAVTRARDGRALLVLRAQTAHFHGRKRQFYGNIDAIVRVQNGLGRAFFAEDAAGGLAGKAGRFECIGNNGALGNVEFMQLGTAFSSWTTQINAHECRGYEKARVKGSTFCRALFAFAIAG